MFISEKQFLVLYLAEKVVTFAVVWPIFCELWCEICPWFNEADKNPKLLA